MKNEIDQLCDRVFALGDESRLNLKLILSALAIDGLHRSSPATTDGICNAFGPADNPVVQYLRLELDSFFFRFGHLPRVKTSHSKQESKQ